MNTSRFTFTAIALAAALAVIPAASVAGASAAPPGGAIVAGGTAGGVGAAGAARPAAATGKVVVQLVGPAKAALARPGVSVTIANPSFTFSQDKTTSAAGRVRYTVPAGVALSVRAAEPGYVTSARTRVTVRPGQTVTVRVVLAKGASIAGTVYSPGPRPLAGSTVTALTASGDTVASTVTAANGRYKLRGLVSGAYRIQFNSRVEAPPRPAVLAAYVWNYWKAASWASSTPVEVHQQAATKPATARSGVDSVVAVGASIRGKLSLRGLAGGAAVGLEAVNGVDRASGRVNVAGTAFSVKAVAGKYRVWVWGDDASDDIWWYTGERTAPSRDEARARVVSFTGASSKTLTFAP